MSNKKGMDIDNIDAENEAYFKDLFDRDEMEVPESLSAENMKMKLEQDVWGDGDEIVAFMYCFEDIPIAGDFLLVPVSGNRLLRHQFPHSDIGS